jgi:hypothetical protein
MRMFIRFIESIIIVLCFLSFCCTIYLWKPRYYNEITGLDIQYSTEDALRMLIGGVALLILAACVRIIKSKKQDLIVYKGRKVVSSIMTIMSILNVFNLLFLLYAHVIT